MMWFIIYMSLAFLFGALTGYYVSVCRSEYRKERLNYERTMYILRRRDNYHE